jgi:hypothetical protein
VKGPPIFFFLICGVFFFSLGLGGSNQRVPKFLTCSPKEFPIAPHFHPVCFGKCRPPFNFIGGPYSPIGFFGGAHNIIFHWEWNLHQTLILRRGRVQREEKYFIDLHTLLCSSKWGRMLYHQMKPMSKHLFNGLQHGVSSCLCWLLFKRTLVTEHSAKNLLF